MAIELRALPRFTFPSKTGGPQTQALTVGFSTLPRSAVAAINGFSIGYTNSDHHLLREEIDVGTQIQNGTQGPEESISRCAIVPGLSMTRTVVLLMWC